MSAHQLRGAAASIAEVRSSLEEEVPRLRVSVPAGDCICFTAAMKRRILITAMIGSAFAGAGRAQQAAAVVGVLVDGTPDTFMLRHRRCLASVRL
jgi:hypothetical protein